MQQRDHARAVGGLVGKLAGDHDIVADHNAVNQAREAAGDDVPLPGGILIPDQLGHATAESDQVGLTVVVDVGDHHLVAAFEIAGYGVFRKVRGRQGKGEGEQVDAFHGTP